MRFPDVAAHYMSRYLIATILAIVACRQLYFAHAKDLTSWLGGGMGMFATIDGLEYRVVRAHLTTTDGQMRPLDVRASGRLRKLEGDIRVMPTAERLQGLARHLALQLEDPLAASIRIECWRMGLDPDTPAVQLTPIIGMTFDLTGASMAVASSP